jgi:hypothetical protein
MSKTIVKYGDYDFGNQPTPFLTRSETFIKAGENWGTQETFTLRGQLTGCGFDAVRSGQKELIGGFGRDFHNLGILADKVIFSSGILVSNAEDDYYNGYYHSGGVSDGIVLYKNYKPSDIFFDNSSYVGRSLGYWRLYVGGFPPSYIGSGSGLAQPYLIQNWSGDAFDPPSFDSSLTVTEANSFESGVEKSLIFSKSGLKVESINFPSNPYKKILDYEIQLSHFPDNYFSQFYGVTNPVDSWDFNEGENGLLNITHNISCKGFNTHSGANNAFQNARNFVYSKTGDQNMINPHFICKNTYPDFYPCLDSFTENINRIDGTYSITENYISDLEGTGRGVLRYQVDLTSGVNDFSTATIRGNIDGCKNADMSPVRARFKEFKFFDTVAEIYNDAFGFVDLNPEGLSTGVQEDSLNKKITFDVSFNNDQSPQTILDVQTNVASGDSHITVSVDGNIRARGDIRARYDKISSIYDNIDIFGYAKNAYISYLGGTPSYPLNPKSESNGVTKDEFTPVISFNATYTNKEIPPEGFESFNRNISVKPSLRSIKPVPLFDQNGTYDIIDLLFDRRARVSVDLNGTASPGTSVDLTNTMKQEGNLLLQTYGRTNDYKLESYNISTGNLGEYSLNATWSFEAANKVFDGTNYDEVNTLKIK